MVAGAIYKVVLARTNANAWDVPAIDSQRFLVAGENTWSIKLRVGFVHLWSTSIGEVQVVVERLVWDRVDAHCHFCDHDCLDRRFWDLEAGWRILVCIWVVLYPAIVILRAISMIPNTRSEDEASLE